ncbi:MAG: hypothetical protein AAF385_15915 [Pseudomonadota bacterium]
MTIDLKGDRAGSLAESSPESSESRHFSFEPNGVILEMTFLETVQMLAAALTIHASVMLPCGS